MDNFQKIIDRHKYLGRLGTALIYSICVSVALNYFWTPGKIYSSGLTGLSQLVHTVCFRFMHMNISIGDLLFLLNIPLFILAWFKIGHRFTVFTIIAVGLSSVMIHAVHPVIITKDPIVCSIFGGAINGFGTGLALKYGLSTGGLDILGIVIRQATGHRIGSINVTFNTLIVLSAGLMYGWPYALYSIFGLVVNATIMDMVYTRQQRIQVIIVTEEPKTVIDSIQHRIHRGMTIINDAEGVYKHKKKAVLFTVISGYEVNALYEAVQESDPHSFVSLTNTVKIMGRFYEPRV